MLGRVLKWLGSPPLIASFQGRVPQVLGCFQLVSELVASVSEGLIKKGLVKHCKVQLALKGKAIIGT